MYTCLLFRYGRRSNFYCDCGGETASGNEEVQTECSCLYHEDAAGTQRPRGPFAAPALRLEASRRRERRRDRRALAASGEGGRVAAPADCPAGRSALLAALARGPHQAALLRAFSGAVAEAAPRGLSAAFRGEGNSAAPWWRANATPAASAVALSVAKDPGGMVVEAPLLKEGSVNVLNLSCYKHPIGPGVPRETVQEGLMRHLDRWGHSRALISANRHGRLVVAEQREVTVASPAAFCLGPFLISGSAGPPSSSVAPRSSAALPNGEDTDNGHALDRGALCILGTSKTPFDVVRLNFALMRC